MAKPNNAAPIDTSVKVPAAVLRAAAAADEIHKQAYNTDPPAEPPVEPVEPIAPAADGQPALTATPTTPASRQPVEPIAPAAIPETAPNGDDSWEQRYKQMKGRWDKQQISVNAMSSRISELERMLSVMQSAAPVHQPAPPAAQPDLSISDEDRSTWGEDMLSVVSRQARLAVKGDLDARDREIAELRSQLGGVSNAFSQDARKNMFARMDQELPNWREQNENSDFLNWLRLPDAYSGAIRGELLEQAFGQNDTHRVLAFFKGFLQEEAVVAPVEPAVPSPATQGKVSLEALAAPGRARSSSTTNNGGTAEKPIITRAQVTKFYADVASGRYHGQDAKKASDEAMIFAAQKEGRIR